MASIDLERGVVIPPAFHGSVQSPENINQTVAHSLEKFPKGFPRLARFLDIDDNFMVYRRFGTAFSRVLLQKQDEISDLETTLRGMDDWDEKDGNTAYLRSRRLDAERESIPSPWQETRSDLIEKLRKNLLDYAQTLLIARQLKALDQPSYRDHQSILNFMYGGGGKLDDESMSFIRMKEDLVTLRPGRQAAWLEVRMEDTLARFRVFKYLFCSKETAMKSKDPNVQLYDRNKVSTLVWVLVFLTVLALLMVPALLLLVIGPRPSSVLLVLSCTLIFSAVLTAATTGKPHEVLAACAGYVCVLLMFMSGL